ncbi:hypothetical protein DFJ74DRAFT_679952 [Hyaloraphidium curvatum]|nr:hypothetical protein DFJ74DRAFT_679952 [Hyaloraphidium curvatum]
MFGIGRGGKQQVTPATAKDSRAEQKPTAGQPKPKAAVGKGIKPVRKPETDSEDDAPLPQLAPPRSASPEKLQLMGTRSKGFGKDANDGDLEVSDTDDEPEPGEGVDLVIHNVPSATMVPALLIDRLVFDFLCWDFTRSLLMEWTYAEKADWIHRKIEAYRAGKEECDGNTDDELREKNPDDPFWAEDEVALMDPRRKRDDQKHWRDRRKLNFPQLHELLVRKASRWFDRVDRIGELIERALSRGAAASPPF